MHPQFDKACRIYAQRRQREKAAAAIDALIPHYQRREIDTRTSSREEYDGLAGYDAADLLDWQRFGTELPQLEGSAHWEPSEAEIARWDSQVDAWVQERGACLDEEPAPEIHPWGYFMEVDGAMVWADDIE